MILVSGEDAQPSELSRIAIRRGGARAEDEARGQKRLSDAVVW